MDNKPEEESQTQQLVQKKFQIYGKWNVTYNFVWFLTLKFISMADFLVVNIYTRV